MPGGGETKTWPAAAQIYLAPLIGLLVGALVFFFLRARGYFTDEGAFCTLAQGILHGEFPYKAYFNEKPPLQYFWTAAVMALTEPTMIGARLASAISFGATLAFILQKPAKRLRHPGELLAWIILAVAVGLCMSAYLDTADSSLALLYSASLWLTLNPSEDVRRRRMVSVVQGAIFGIALGFRQTAIAPALVMLLLPEGKLPKMPFVGGFMLGLLGWLVPVLLLGMGPDLVRSTLTFYADNPHASTYLREPRRTSLGAVAVWLLGLVWFWTKPGTGSEQWKQRAWFVALVIAMGLQAFGRMEPFRLWPSMAAMLVLLAHTPIGPKIAARAIAAAAAAIALIATLYRFPQPVGDFQATAEAIAAMTSPSDRVWVGPGKPLGYCLAQRRPSSRYYFIMPWTAKPEVTAQILHDVALPTTKLIVLFEDPRLQDMLPGLDAVLAQHYRPAGIHGGARFYVHKD